jgi:hypothetical protein
MEIELTGQQVERLDGPTGWLGAIQAMSGVFSRPTSLR